MRGAATRAALRAKGSWAGARLPARAGRLAGEAGPRPDFAALAAWSEWIALPETERQRIGAVAALLDARDALADEIDGARLRAYADRIGDAALEAIIAIEDRGAAALPVPEDLPGLATQLLVASLDADAARLAEVMPQPAPAAAALVRRAEALCRRIPHR